MNNLPKPRRQLLIINPNTSEAVSETLRGIALQEAAKRTDLALDLRLQTARLGASYISDEISFALAGHALLDAYAFDLAQHPDARPDAVLIACFGDPGLLALQQLCPVPVLGLAQASVAAAHAQGAYAVVTGGQAWVPMLKRLIVQLGLHQRLVALEAVEKTGPQLAADKAAAVIELSDLCECIVRQTPEVQSIVLGGAALGGLAQAIQQMLMQRGVTHVQLMDSVRASIQAAMDAALRSAANAPTDQATRVQTDSKNPERHMNTSNLSAELKKLLD
jgi:allantoin racemase